MKYIYFFTLFSVTLFACKNPGPADSRKDKATIIQVLQAQQEAWNQGDLEKFMIGYFEDDSLMFVGSSGIVYGYDNTLERYKRTYSSREKMGKLTFTVRELKSVTSDVYFMVGNYHLERDSIENVEGLFTLVWKKEGADWVIAADHSE